MCHKAWFAELPEWSQNVSLIAACFTSSGIQANEQDLDHDGKIDQLQVTLAAADVAAVVAANVQLELSYRIKARSVLALTT